MTWRQVAEDLAKALSHSTPQDAPGGPFTQLAIRALNEYNKLKQTSGT